MLNTQTAKVSLWKLGIMMGIVSRQTAEDMKSTGTWEEWIPGNLRPKDKNFW